MAAFDSNGCPMSRNYVFTWKYYDGLPSLRDFDGLVSYLVFTERMSLGGTPFVFGYVELYRPVSISDLESLLPASFVPVSGPSHEAISRVQHTGPTWISGPYSFGYPSPLPLPCPRPVSFDTLTIWVGPPSFGLTYAAFLGNPDAFWVPPPLPGFSALLWDSYSGEDTIILDNFSGWLSLDYLLRLSDDLPFMLETETSMVPCLATKVIILTSRHPYSWYGPDYVDWQPFDRRIAHIRHYTGPGEFSTCWDLDSFWHLMG